MIKINDGDIEIDGRRAEILVETTMLLCCLLRDKLITEDDFDKVIELARKYANKTDEEIEKDAIEKIKELKKIKDFIDGLIK